MTVDPSHFFILNIIDTCSIWNLLSSKILFSAAKSKKCNFNCTHFVFYECCIKPRKNTSPEEVELKKRYLQARKKGDFKDYYLELEDLNEIDILRSRRNLGKGELSSIVFAKRTQQAFLTDDQKARKFAKQILGDIKKVQTIPHLFGWLIFIGILSDQDKDLIIDEHKNLKRPLEKYFSDIYQRTLEFKLKQNITGQ